MDEVMTSFEQILGATLRMVRTTWKAPACLFFQLDDAGTMRVRAADGLARETWVSLSLPADKGVAGKCLTQNVVLESGRLGPEDPLAVALNPLLTAGAVKFTIAPVAGQSRPLGILILGPFPK